ncbi:MAG: VOC family protein [Bacteroidetes bacterium]|nr:VOC family protein [Bacteroidota bacterium]
MANATIHPVVHFELGCKDLAATTAFYTGLFGWSPVSVPMASLINTNSTEGIQGHITSLGHEPHNYVMFYIQVEDILASLDAIAAAGGKKLVGPVTLPDGKQFAWFKDPEGNMVGLTTKSK